MYAVDNDTSHWLSELVSTHKNPSLSELLTMVHNIPYRHFNRCPYIAFVCMCMWKTCYIKLPYVNRSSRCWSIRVMSSTLMRLSDTLSCSLKASQARPLSEAYQACWGKLISPFLITKDDTNLLMMSSWTVGLCTVVNSDMRELWEWDQMIFSGYVSVTLSPIVPNAALPLSIFLSLYLLPVVMVAKTTLSPATSWCVPLIFSPHQASIYNYNSAIH